MQRFVSEASKLKYSVFKVVLRAGLGQTPPKKNLKQQRPQHQLFLHYLLSESPTKRHPTPFVPFDNHCPPSRYLASTWPTAVPEGPPLITAIVPSPSTDPLIDRGRINLNFNYPAEVVRMPFFGPSGTGYR